MSPDEIFVLILIVGCIGAVATMAVHSRRREKSGAAADDPPRTEDATPAIDTAVNVKRGDRGRRR